MKNFPGIKELKLLEKNSQKNGSGIVYEELLGIWTFQYVCGKESDEIKNSINFGLLNIIFTGSAELIGPRPLLTFYFENLKISIGNFQIFYKALKKLEDKNMPFFSLIGISTKEKWMCARGRGGGLAIWVKY